MQVKIADNIDDVRRRVGKKGEELSASIKKALSITAQAGINIIEARTSKGKAFFVSEVLRSYKGKNGP